MDKEDISNSQSEPRWFIDVDWYQPNNRSFSTLAQGRLCPKCWKRLKVDKGEIPAADLLSNIGDCCSKTPDFITGDLPVVESVFRLFLANGNQPLGLEELQRQLGERRGGDIYRTPVEILPRLLASDQYYGIRQFSAPSA